MQVGFGLWEDNNSGKLGWHPDEPRKNHFQPQTWQTAIYDALSYSDEYVWIWHERYNLWTNKNVGEAYQAAQDAGRSAPGSTVADAPSELAEVPHADKAEGHDDAATFADLMGNHEVLLDLTSADWKFHTDPNAVGVKDQWFRSDLDTSGWAGIEIDKFWEEQGRDYDGVAWYRVTFTAHPPAGKKVSLVFGAVDESATVWLNGEEIGTHDTGEGGWKDRFEFDVTGKVRPGENMVAVRVLDRTGPGGIWKRVKLMVEK
jgi:hypothetical protein